MENFQDLLNILEHSKFSNNSDEIEHLSFTFPSANFGNRGSFDSGFRSSFQEFTFPSSNFADEFTCRSFNSSFNSNHNSSFNSSFDGFRASFRAGFDSSFNSSFNSSFDGFATNFTFKNFESLKPLSYQTKITYDDIRTIYDNLNIVKKQYGLLEEGIPDKKDKKAIPQDISDLKTLIETMRSNSHILSNASTDNVEIPNAGNLIKNSPFTELNDVIIRIHDNCINFIGVEK